MPENTPKNPNIDMSDEYAALIPGAKQYPYKVHGFNIDNVLLGLKPNLVQLVKNNPSNHLGVVVLSNDFKDRGHAAGAIKGIMEAEGLGSHQVYPTNPEHPVPDGCECFPLSMPWTNLIPNVTPELRATALSRKVMHGLYEEQHYCFYFIDLTFAQPPFLVLTYRKLADGTEPADVKAALLDKFLSDAWVLNTTKDHTYLPNETKPEVLFRTILEFASFLTFNYFLDSAKHTVWSIVMPPLSTDPANMVALQCHLMESPGFSFDVGFFGTAFPWCSPNGRLISPPIRQTQRRSSITSWSLPASCLIIDHYRQECTITTSDNYLLRCGTHPDLPSVWNTSSKLPTSLNDEMDTSDSAGPSNHMGSHTTGGCGRFYCGNDRRQGGFNGHHKSGGSRDWQPNSRGSCGFRAFGLNSRSGGFPY
ncbi:hypothetical protein B0H10DRAFT_2210680 [Mycena sp. CBHHK59/15]|nr:hypothetical protein B0H10DRAFT_2210680 [Mycena sp. CBHHK59/15]